MAALIPDKNVALCYV